jgi:hypothetical protein
MTACRRDARSRSRESIARARGLSHTLKMAQRVRHFPVFPCHMMLALDAVIGRVN